MVREQAIQVLVTSDDVGHELLAWRCIKVVLDMPAELGESIIQLWINLPAPVDAATLAVLYCKRWCIEGRFQRLEIVLHSEIKSPGHLRAALSDSR